MNGEKRARTNESHLKLHDVAACWSTHKTGANVKVLFVHRANISWVLIVVNNLVWENGKRKKEEVIL